MTRIRRLFVALVRLKKHQVTQRHRLIHWGCTPLLGTPIQKNLLARGRVEPVAARNSIHVDAAHI